MLAFEAGGERLAIEAAKVREVVDAPRLTRLPHAPPGLIGVANIRGSALPILSTATLRGRAAGVGRRVLVLDHDPAFGLLVDSVDSLHPAGGLTEVDPDELLRPALKPAAGPRTSRSSVMAHEAETTAASDDQVGLLVFLVAGQAFALPLEQARETLAFPDAVTPLQGSDPAVLGTIAHRGMLLPLLSLNVLLALPQPAPGRHWIVVALIQGRPVGLVVDDLRSVIRVPADSLDPVPAIIARRSAETRINAICRLENGRRLISVLDADQLLRSVDASQLVEQRMDMPAEGSATETMTEPLVVFRIGTESFALPAAAVEEIVRRPERLTRVPRAPKFVEGIMNLRGHPVPVIDQRRRFDAAVTAQSRDRILVVALGSLRAGFVVDDVKEVVRLPGNAVSRAPEISDGTRIIDRIAALNGGEQILLLIDPAEMLDATERQMLTALGTKTAQAS